MKNLSFFVGLILTLSLLWPLVKAPYFTHHDDVQIIRLFEMDRCIKDLQIPCRWVPDLGGLYGYPIFNYYAPLPYYFGELFYLLSGNLLFAAKVMFLTPFIGAYIFMYLFARRYWGNWGGFLSGVFYSFAPYHGVVLYVRGAMGELWALMFFPAVFWAAVRLKEKINLLNSLILALVLAGFIIAHNLSAMLFIPVTIAWILLTVGWRIKILKFYLLSFILGLLLSCFYWLPMLTEKSLVHVETTTYGYFSYTEHFKGLRKLFLDRSWGWGASVREYPGGEKDGMSFQIGIVHQLALILSVAGIRYLWKKRKGDVVVISFFSVLTAFCIFMVHPRSEFVWKSIDPLKYLQFPWRFLMLIVFSISFICGSILVWWKKTDTKIPVIVLTVLVVGANFSYFKPEKFLNVTQEQLLSGSNWDRQIKRSIFDYLPKSAKAPPAELAKSDYEIIMGDIKISDLKKGSDWITFQANARTLAIIRLSAYYFPNWVVLVDGKEVEINQKNDLGLITFAIDPGSHKVEAKLTNTIIRNVGNVLSMVGVLVFIVLFCSILPTPRKWMFYYLKAFN